MTATELAGEPITAKAHRAALGNGTAGWAEGHHRERLVLRPFRRGIEDVYKIYAESFKDPEHLAEAGSRQGAGGIQSSGE